MYVVVSVVPNVSFAIFYRDVRLDSDLVFRASFTCKELVLRKAWNSPAHYKVRTCSSGSYCMMYVDRW